LENVGVDASAASLWSAARRDLAMFFSYIDGAETVLRGSAFVGLTGGPSADFNMALFGEDLDDLAVFDDFVSRVNATGLSALAILSGAGNRRLGPVAKAKGLIEAGTAPLMATSGPVHGATSEFVTKRAKEARDMSTFGELAASAFAMDRSWVDRTFAAASLVDAPALRFYITYRGDVQLRGRVDCRNLDDEHAAR
jgi:hypothetical protein